MKAIGLGSQTSAVNFYIANRPGIDDYAAINKLRGLEKGELDFIVKNTSNHWRKAFNVYAKLLFDWYLFKGHKNLPQRWQDYRDLELFQSSSQEALLFSPPLLTEKLTEDNHCLHIIAGKTYANRLDLPPLVWLDTHFAINKEYRLIVAPYPDYRQLSNERIAHLIELMKLQTSKLIHKSLC